MNDTTSTDALTEPVIEWCAATPDDLDDIWALERELFPLDAWTPEMIREELSFIPDTREYVVGRVTAPGHQLVGYGGIAVFGPDSDLMTFAIEPSFQRRGLGTQFLDQLLGIARERGCSHMFLEVRADNQTALRLYQRAGFVAGERRRRYYRDGGDAVLMSLELAAKTTLESALTPEGQGANHG